MQIYILSPEARDKDAHYPNVFIPSKQEVEDQVRADFGSVYARLFTETLAQHQRRTIVNEYALQTTSCDPCPAPPLSPSDLATLGGDVLLFGLASSIGRGSPSRCMRLLLKETYGLNN